MNRRAVIIGAGPAGLTAAHELLSRTGGEWEVTVLEASRAMGGISRTVVHNGNRMDMGGHRFFSKDARVVEWWKGRLPLQGAPAFDDLVLGRGCLLAPNGPDPEQDDGVMLGRHRISRIYYGGKFFDYPVSLSPRTLGAMGPITTARVGASYISSMIHKRQECSLEDFYVNRFGRRLYNMFFEGYTEKLWGRHPRDISPDWGAQRVRGLSVGKVLTDTVMKAVGRQEHRVGETSLIDSFWYPKLGPGQLWEYVSSEIQSMGGTIVTDARVAGFKVCGDGSIECVRLEDGRAFAADAVFSSMPLCDLVGAMPRVDPTVASIAKGLPYRDFVTVGLLVPNLSLKNDTRRRTLANIVPDNWIYVQDSSVQMGRIQVFNNWSPYLVADPLRTVWLGLEYFCDEGDQLWRMGDKLRVAESVRELVSMGVLAPGTEIVDAHVEYVRKAYPAYFDTYVHMPALRSWLDEHPNLYCIGRNGQHRYNNMDHSMLTAFNAVDVLLSGDGDKTCVWNVNTDDEYHEEQGGE